ncbi:MAG: hypothetical protein IPO98_07135 [Saprospiraceae bacterium]|nr:hypothetical protein [Saprospiraceae bacterium]
MDKYEIINGSRILKGSVVKNRSILRENTSRTFNQLVTWILNVRLTYRMYGFKLFKKPTVIQLINTGIRTEGWFFFSELLVKAIWSDITVTEIPVRWTDAGHSKVDIAMLTGQYLKEIFRLKKERENFKKLEK